MLVVLADEALHTTVLQSHTSYDAYNQAINTRRGSPPGHFLMLRLGTSHYDCGAATYANAHGKEPPVQRCFCWAVGMGWDGMIPR